MRVLFACGGTAGHINPALAVAEKIKELYPDSAICFAGNPHGMEQTLVIKAGFEFRPIEVEGIQRHLDINSTKRNIHALKLLLKSEPTARYIINEFKPDVVVGTGGYVSGPVLMTAHFMKIKTVTHEQNAFPGVTTKLLSSKVDKILIAMKGAIPRLKADSQKIVFTGNPVRKDIIKVTREEARKILKLKDEFCILSFGGSLGAEKINESVLDVISWHKGQDNVHHIHATGTRNYSEFMDEIKKRNISLNSNLDIREYIDDMPICLAAADVVICRAGAISLSELECAGKASILIPSPYVAENHQYHNAMELVNNNAALIIEEKYLDGEILIENIKEIKSHPDKLKEIEKNIKELAVFDASDRIVKEIVKVLEG